MARVGWTVGGAVKVERAMGLEGEARAERRGLVREWQVAARVVVRPT